MSPRSNELLQAAQRRLAAASVVVEEDPSTALSAAYYAMLNAARAALSERDISAKTHRGIWHELRRALVDTGELDADLAASVQKIQPEREQADYDAWFAPDEDARNAIDLAQQFLAAIEATLEPRQGPTLPRPSRLPAAASSEGSARRCFRPGCLTTELRLPAVLVAADTQRPPQFACGAAPFQALELRFIDGLADRRRGDVDGNVRSQRVEPRGDRHAFGGECEPGAHRQAVGGDEQFQLERGGGLGLAGIFFVPGVSSSEFSGCLGSLDCGLIFSKNGVGSSVASNSITR